METPVNPFQVAVLIFIFITLISSSCSKKPFVPVNTGREYGNPTTPFVVSHIPIKNRWALARSGHHNIFQKLICFSYPCRKMIGRRKALNAISFEEFKRKTKKNGKKGAYKKYFNEKPVRDTVPLIAPEIKDTVTIAKIEIPVAPILKADSLIILDELLFELNSYKLKNQQLSKLDSIGKFLEAHPTLEVRVSGHTDNTGTERHNVTLSTRRAEVVAEYLIDHGAVYEKVYYQGFGSAQPIATNATSEGRSKNRRVEILIRNPM